MKNKVIKQFAVGFLAVLSLFVSTIAACGCSHHQVKSEADAPSCHQISHETKNRNSQEKDSSLPKQETAFDVSCVCFMPSAPKVFGKNETVKIQKQAALLTAEIEIVYGFVLARVPSATRFAFSEISLSDSSYNIKSPRAPPPS